VGGRVCVTVRVRVAVRVAVRVRVGGTGVVVLVAVRMRVCVRVLVGTRVEVPVRVGSGVRVLVPVRVAVRVRVPVLAGGAVWLGLGRTVGVAVGSTAGFESRQESMALPSARRTAFQSIAIPPLWATAARGAPSSKIDSRPMRQAADIVLLASLLGFMELRRLTER
jgi:hypothetical protein